jgi:hypothetical protein
LALEAWLGLAGYSAVMLTAAHAKTLAVSPCKIFMIFQTALLRKPECDEGQYHDDVKRNCSWAQDDRSKF